MPRGFSSHVAFRSLSAVGLGGLGFFSAFSRKSPLFSRTLFLSDSDDIPEPILGSYNHNVRGVLVTGMEVGMKHITHQVSETDQNALAGN